MTIGKHWRTDPTDAHAFRRDDGSSVAPGGRGGSFWVYGPGGGPLTTEGGRKRSFQSATAAMAALDKALPLEEGGALASQQSGPPHPADGAARAHPRHPGGKVLRWSNWTLGMTDSCEIYYQKRILEDQRTPASANMIRGRAVDEAITADLQHQIDKGQLLPKEEVEAIAGAVFGREWNSQPIRLLPKEKAEGGEALIDRLRSEAIIAALHYHEEEAAKVWPIALQQKFEIDLSDRFGFKLTGRIDVTEKARVRDIKSSGKSPNKTAADDSLQLTFYALAFRTIYGFWPDVLSLDQVVVTPKRRTRYVQVQETRRGDADGKALIKRAIMATDVVRRGIFRPAPPDSWKCGPNYCEFWESCYFGARSRLSRAAPNLEAELPARTREGVDATEARETREETDQIDQSVHQGAAQ